MKYWRLEVKERHDKFSATQYGKSSLEKKVGPRFQKIHFATGELDEVDTDPTCGYYELTHSYFVYSNCETFWVNEKSIPFIVEELFVECLDDLTQFGDVRSLNIHGVQGMIDTVLLSKRDSLSNYIKLRRDENESIRVSSRPVPRSRGGTPKDPSKVPWSDEWVTKCSNLRFGQELGRAIATLKHTDNRIEERQGDYDNILRVAGPDTIRS